MLASAIDQLVARGTVVVAASGNDGDHDEIGAPACITNVIAVGATYDANLNAVIYPGICTDPDSATNVDLIPCFSNASPALDLLAPGARITSLGLTGGPDDQSGTSMAAPHVAGAAAVLMSARPSITPAEIESVLESTGVPVMDSRNSTTYPRLNLTAALSAVLENEAIQDGGFEETPSTGNTNPAWLANFSMGHNVFRKGESYSRTGTAHAHLGGGSGSSTDIIRQDFEIPSNATVGNLRFALNIVTNETSGAPSNDDLFVDLYRQNGSYIGELVAFSNQDSGESSNTDGTYFEVGPIPIYETGELRLVFQANNNSSAVTTFRIDDVSILVSAPDLPTVTVTASDAEAAEAPGGNPGVFTFTRTGSTTSSLTVHYSTGGTATSTSDYGVLSGTMTFSSGEGTKQVTVTPVDDDDVESSETVTVTISADSDYDVGTPSGATVTIRDNDAPVTVTAADSTASEAGPENGTFTISRGGPTTEALTVSYTIGGTASNGVDYTSLSGTATIAAGNSSVDVVVSPIPDSDVEGNETVTLTIASGSTYKVGSPSVGTVTISDQFGPPSNVVATAIATTTVRVTWSAGPGASSYRVYRSSDRLNYTLVGSPTDVTFDDATASANTSYFYKVRSFAASSESIDSNLDLATTVMFTDDPIVAGVTAVKAVHMTQLLTAINAVRALGGLAPAAFSAPVPAAQGAIRAQHVSELRTHLDAGRSASGLSTPAYTDPSLSTAISVKAAHVSELRNAVK
jgi:hypothetical protein